MILVAGRGERLRPLTSRAPKSLVPVAGKAILGRMIETLEKCGINSVVLVTGYRARQVQEYVGRHSPGLNVRFVRNPIYAKTNTLYSLLKARRYVAGRSFLLIDGDLVFAPRVLRALLRTDSGNFLVCDRSVALDAEAVRAIGNARGVICKVGKNSRGKGNPLGESIGLAKIGKQASRRLFTTGKKVLSKQGLQHYYEAAFQAMIDAGIEFRAVDTRGAKWAEIDTKTDLRRAQASFDKSAKHAR